MFVDLKAIMHLEGVRAPTVSSQEQTFANSSYSCPKTSSFRPSRIDLPEGIGAMKLTVAQGTERDSRDRN
jgi:hypothetical protein